MDAWVIDFTNVPDANDGASDEFTLVLFNFTINWFWGYANEYDGRAPVSITRRVFPPGCSPVRNDFNEFGAASAIRGTHITAITEKKLTCKRPRLEILIWDKLYQILPPHSRPENHQPHIYIDFN